MIFIENTMVRTAKSAGYLGNAGSEMQINSQLLRQRVNELEARIERMELEVADK
jgi:hypothetical protein